MRRLCPDLKRARRQVGELGGEILLEASRDSASRACGRICKGGCGNQRLSLNARLHGLLHVDQARSRWDPNLLPRGCTRPVAPKFLLTDNRHFASLLFLGVPITAEGGRTIGLSTITSVFTVRFITPEPVVSPGRDMMMRTAILSNFVDQ